MSDRPFHRTTFSLLLLQIDVRNSRSTQRRLQIFFREGETSTFCLTFSGFNANGRSQNALKVPSPNIQGEMPALPSPGDAPWFNALLDQS